MLPFFKNKSGISNTVTFWILWWYYNQYWREVLKISHVHIHKSGSLSSRNYLSYLVTHKKLWCQVLSQQNEGTSNFAHFWDYTFPIQMWVSYCYRRQYIYYLPYQYLCKCNYWYQRPQNHQVFCECFSKR